MPLFPVPRLLEHLLGSWTLRRQIVDRRSALTFTVEGCASWLLGDGGAVLYSEEGLLRGLPAPAPPTAVRASYVYTPGPQASAARVAFADGRAFHDLDLACGDSGVLAHACAPDDYTGRVMALGPHALRMEWRVRGPSKDYDAVTDLMRMANGR